MSDLTNLLTRPATELAELIRDGEVTSRELTEAALARIEALNPRVNAFTALDADRALETADGVGAGDERPFAGVPIAIKDLFTPIQGFRQTNCSELLAKGAVADFDHNVVARVRSAGFVIVGVTNSPEFGIVPVTEPRLNGPSRNPWNLERTPGGSSGGSAAAVSAGMVPLAHGSDGGGSIRIPAACCGLFGLKPSRGRVSPAPFTSGSLELSQSGPISVSVRDAAAFLDVLAGYEPGDAHWAPPPERPFLDEVGTDPGRLRIAFTAEPAIPNDVDPRAVTVARAAADALSDLGHDVVERTLPWGQPDALDLFARLWQLTPALYPVPD